VTPPHVTGTARPEVVSEEIPRGRPAWIDLVTSADHKNVGRMYIATALFFAAIALTELVMMRVQLLLPDNTLIRPEIFDQLLSAYGVTALLLFALPLAIGLFTYVLPLQIGARGYALSRVLHLSYWMYLFGGLAIYLSFLYSPSEAGTMAVPPLSDSEFLAGRAVDAWLIGVSLILIGFVLWAISTIATMRSSRAPGLVWRRVPPFAWAGTVVAYTLLTVSAIMLAALAMQIIDRQFGGVFFIPGDGGAPLLYVHLSSIFLTGAYISVVIAALGAISEIFSTFSRQPHFGQGTFASSFGALAVLAVLAWMVNMYSAPIPIGFLYFAMLMALAAAVPVGLIVFNWIGTLSGGRTQMRIPVVYALGAAAFTILGLAGELAQAVIPVGWQLADTGAALGDTYAALIGAGVLGGFAGLYYWFPKLNGTLMGESLGRASFGAIVLGSLLLIIPTQLAGLEGMPVDVDRFFGDTGITLLNVLASIGGFIFALGVLLTLVNAATSLHKGVKAGPDPWGGATLEWFAPSPPPIHNFDLVPDVRSESPLADIRDAVRRRQTRWNPPPARAAGAAEEAPEPAPVAVQADSEGESSEAEDDRPVA
jgi:heme/copper-type cytochrome/quinol oxidase subunit 1